MDKLKTYRELIRKVLLDYRSLENASDDSELESLVLLDDVEQQYLMVRTGWDRSDRIERIAIHVRLKNEKIWIEEDCTEEGVATDFLQAGVPREDIVLGFHPQHLRQYTEFAIA